MTLTLNSYTLLILLACGNFLCIALYTQVVREGRDYIANCFLAAFCLFFCIGNLDYIFIPNHYYNYYPRLIGMGDVASLLLGPLLYLYVLLLSSNDHRFKWKYLIHLAPVTIYMIWLLPFKLKDINAQVQEFDRLVSGLMPFPVMVAYYNKVVNLIYILMIFFLLRKHHSVVKQLVSTAEENSLNWIRNLALFAFPLYLCWFLQNQGLVDDHFFGVGNLLFSYYLGYHVIQQKSIYTTLSNDFSVNKIDASGTKYKNSILTVERKTLYKDRLDALMVSEKPFKDKELSLTMLADKVEIKPGYLSQILNEDYRESFYTFINRYRIEESKRLLLDKRYQNYNILSIAYEAGFNSKSTFNKVFRESVGVSPSEYQKQHLV
ncbi:helix-turn-helix transcriptional regulator [Pedobacter nutrimenti]|jgi:AraC-like DNA-binding protein|uniref:Helix-turn-helix protein n=1 Tax=Pedobacter nutrimenti TaxID=1241337 RepID=A0A318UFG1_9SPHI|nr:helix-turn-helix transcriptional regulator [Pedobacter nutrimenti]PYF74901.1 helix-turn-helix protein [Pedobacter nutrimenti]